MNWINKSIAFWNKLFPSDVLSEEATHEEVEAKFDNAPTFEQMKAEIKGELTAQYDSKILELTEKVNGFEQKVSELNAANDALKLEKEAVAAQLSEAKEHNAALTLKSEALAKELATIKASTVVVESDEKPESGLNKFQSKLMELKGESKY